MTGELSRYYLKHKADPTTYAVEADERGEILSALDVTDEAAKGGLCPHLLTTLPLAARIDDVESLNRHRDEFHVCEPDCRNTHHLLSDLLALERDYRTAVQAWEVADGEAKVLKKRMEAQGEKVHALLQRIQDRKPLPLFEQSAA